ncbi:4'-phosphopantetheinyl transferase family protein [Methylobacterium nigriterrae]|uniref:4'-phosphopantetheinyl transferase family protein n=1 Tax=Methylobacterium nigriterrae TaxID=3127512 RepID=UPI0030141B91
MTSGSWATLAPGPAGGTAVWSIDLRAAEARLAACGAVLSAQERARADRFQRAEDRARFLASHAALRLILGRALDADPGALAFAAEPSGKPVLAEGQAVAFNLSHSGDRALVGLSTEARIGVDVEAVRPMPDAARVARSYFAPDEAAALAALSPPALGPAFLAVWTRKEAVVKAIGAGLAMPLDRFSVSLPPGPARLLRFRDGPETAAAWTLVHLDPDSAHLGAAAVARASARPVLLALPSCWPDLLTGPAG